LGWKTLWAIKDMTTMDTSLSPAFTMPSLRPYSGAINNIEQSSVTDLHSSIVLHAVSVIEAHKLLLEAYRFVWQFLQQSQYSDQMPQQKKGSAPGEMMDGGNDPEPPAAPP
jgi:hypothetical protein